jgi:hypothetical protein
VYLQCSIDAFSKLSTKNKEQVWSSSCFGVLKTNESICLVIGFLQAQQKEGAETKEIFSSDNP